jgi:membrane-bound serine protease (ClpP class)
VRNALRAITLTFGVALVTIGVVAGPAATVQSDPGSPQVVSLRLDGVVDPLVADYVHGGIENASQQGADAVLITIDTPGGLDSSMREIVQAILGADVPVIGYVAPAGARAASAGTFILLACNVAAMAPGTNVGAATPVGLSGAVASQKALNDAVAYIRGIAQERGRNADWAATAVTDAASVPAEEALRLEVIDHVEPTAEALLSTVDGTLVTIGNGSTVTLYTAGAQVRPDSIGAVAGFFHSLLDPNLAFIFFWLGLAFIVAEFFVPGGVVGTLGAIMLVLSVVALGMLPVQLIGVALLVASIVFFVLELKHPGFGVASVAGVVCLVLGGWFLFDRAVPNARVSPSVIAPVAVFALAYFLFVVRAAMRLRRQAAPPVTRDDSIIGRDATVLRAIDPLGVVRVAAEQWSAESTGPAIEVGERVRVVGKDGIRLKVEPMRAPASAREEGARP